MAGTAPIPALISPRAIPGTVASCAGVVPWGTTATTTRGAVPAAADVAGANVPSRHNVPTNIAGVDRTFAKFTFFKIDPAWQRRDTEARAEDKREFLAACEDFAADRPLRAYSTIGTRGDVDLLLLSQSPILEEIHTFHVVLAQSGTIRRQTLR